MSEYVIHDEATETDIDVKIRRRIRHKAKRFVVTQIGFSSRNSIKGRLAMGTPVLVTMSDTQTATLTIVAEDAEGAVAAVAAPPVWTSTDPQGVLTPAADGMSCTVRNLAVTAPSKFSVVTATGNGVLPGGGPDPADVITQEFNFTVTSSEATQFVATATVGATPPSPTLATSFTDNAAFTAAVTAYNAAGGLSAVTLDGAAVGTGTATPALVYFSHSNSTPPGAIDMTGPTS